MKYDVQIGTIVNTGLSYAELIAMPIGPETFVRRENSDWIKAKDCVELSHVVYSSYDGHAPEHDHIPVTSGVNEQANENPYRNNAEVEAHINQLPAGEIPFSPNPEYFKCRQKRKAAIIGVCTLGLAGLALVGIGNIWRGNIFEGTSLSANAGLGFVLKCISFAFLTVLFAVPYFIYSVFALIYYSVKLKRL